MSSTELLDLEDVEESDDRLDERGEREGAAEVRPRPAMRSDSSDAGEGSVLIATSPTATVGDLKTAAHYATGYEPIDQELRFRGRVLARDTHALARHGISPNDTVVLQTAKPDVPPSRVKVALPPSLHAVFGPSLRVAATSSDVAGDVKARLGVITGVPTSMMEALALAGRPLGEEGMLDAAYTYTYTCTCTCTYTYTYTYTGSPLGEEDMLDAAGALERGATLTLTLSEEPPIPRFLVGITPRVIDIESMVEALLSRSNKLVSSEAMVLKRVLAKHAKRLSEGAASRIKACLAQIEAADGEMRQAIEGILARRVQPPLEATAYRAVLEAHRGAGSASTARRLGSLLAEMEAADVALRAALQTSPSTIAVLRAADERYGDAASPSLRKELQQRLRDFDDANSAIKAAIDEIAERAALPSVPPPYEAAAHRRVLQHHSGKATVSLVEMLEVRLREMDAADEALRQAMQLGTDRLRDALLTHGAACSPSLEVAAKAKLDRLDPSRRASVQVERLQVQRPPPTSKVVNKPRVDTRRKPAPPARQRTQRQPVVVYHTKDWSKVQSRWHENNRWHGKGSKTHVLQDVEGQLVRLSARERASGTSAVRASQPVESQRTSVVEMANPLSSARRRSIIDGLNAVGEGMQTIYHKFVAKPKDARPGVYASIQAAPLLEGPNGGGGLRVQPYPLEGPPSTLTSTKRH